MYAPIPEVSYICRLILLQLASLADTEGFFLKKGKIREMFDIQSLLTARMTPLTD